MMWFWEHGNQLLLLFLAPVLGLIFDLTLEKKTVTYLLLISAVLLLPVLTGFEYIIPYAYQILGLILLSCLYSFYSKKITSKAPKIISAILIGGLSFCVLGYFAFMDSMSGYQEVQNSWTIKNYKIEYIKDQGFAGRPLIKYEISKYGLIPLFIKKVDIAVDDDTANSCIVHFAHIKIDFDKCNISLTETKLRR